MSDRWRRIRDVLIVNWTLKLLAVALAVLTFYTIRNQTGFEVPYAVPVDIQVGAGLAVLDKSLSQVDVTFRGTREDLRRLDQSQIKAVVRPQETSPGGTEVIQIRPRDIVGAGHVRVVAVRPSSLTLTYDRQAERDVLVLRPKTMGTPLVGRAEVDFDPKSVRLRGPKRRLENINAVSCEPIDVDGRVESFTRRVRILSPGDAWVYEIRPPEIEARVTIVTEVENRRFDDIPVLAITAPGQALRVDMTPQRVGVVLQARVDVLETIAPSAIQAYVMCVDLDPGVAYDLPVQVYLPIDEYVVIQTDPPSVQVVMRES